MAKKHVGFRIDEELLKRIEGTEMGITEFFTKAAEHYLSVLNSVEQNVQQQTDDEKIAVVQQRSTGVEQVLPRDLDEIKTNVLAISHQLSAIDFTKSSQFMNLIAKIGAQEEEIKALRGEIKKIRRPIVPSGYYSSDEIIRYGGFWGSRVLRKVQKQIKR